MSGVSLRKVKLCIAASCLAEPVPSPWLLRGYFGEHNTAAQCHSHKQHVSICANAVCHTKRCATVVYA